MGRGKRTVNRKEQMTYEEEDKDEREEKEDEEEEEDEDEEAEASDEDGGDGDDGGDDDDEKPKKKGKAKAKKKPTKAATTKPKRTRAAKVVRMRAFWGVFNNSNALVAKFDYAKRKDAEDHAAKLRAEKNQTYFVIQQKEPME
jgi:hypothetical protein